MEFPKETSRLDAFSDGVFAIAITLLIIELHVPEVDGGASALLAALAHLWPSYFAFALSFVTILIMWMNHHAMFLWVHRPNGALFVGNGLLLLTITAVPFSTALLGTYLGHDGERAAAGVYALHLVAINLAYTALWWTLTRKATRAAVAPRLDAAEVRRTNQYLAFSCLAYATAAVLAWWSAAASVTLTVLLAAFWTWNAYRRLRVEAAA